MRFELNAKIGVLLGGISAEREISLKTGRAISHALRDLGYSNVIEIDVDKNILQNPDIHNLDVGFIALHGEFGEDGIIQAILELLGVPYTGTGVSGSAVCMSKSISKSIFEAKNIPTPKWFTSGPTDLIETIHEKIEEIGYPIVAKPSNGGSTYGLTVVNSKNEVKNAQKHALQFDSEVLWEKYILGTELTVAILDDKPLPVIEIEPLSGLFDFEAKYTKGKTNYYCPARISQETAEQAKALSVKAFRGTGCHYFGRVDLLLQDQSLYVLEVNTVPGMTETSLVPKAAQVAGLEFTDVVASILENAMLHSMATKAKNGKS